VLTLVLPPRKGRREPIRSSEIAALINGGAAHTNSGLADLSNVVDHIVQRVPDAIRVTLHSKARRIQPVYGSAECRFHNALSLLLKRSSALPVRYIRIRFPMAG
jgi:hypothetical protein